MQRIETAMVVFPTLLAISALCVLVQFALHQELNQHLSAISILSWEGTMATWTRFVTTYPIRRTA